MPHLSANLGCSGNYYYYYYYYYYYLALILDALGITTTTATPTCEWSKSPNGRPETGGRSEDGQTTTTLLPGPPPTLPHDDSRMIHVLLSIHAWNFSGRRA